MAREVARHQVAILGQVTDAHLGRALPGARVEITSGPPEFTSWLALRARQFGERWAALAKRPDRAHTAADGIFYFLDLPPGDYTLTASLPGGGSRYGQATVQARLARNQGQDTVTMERVTLAVPTTSIKGNVFTPGAGKPPGNPPPNKPIPMAEIRVQGSGEQVWSDAQGNYALSGLETGTRIVVVSLQGYQNKTQTVTLSKPGAVVTLDFHMQPSPA